MKQCWCILLVEDDAALGPLMTEALNLLGHDSVLAADGDALYRYLSREHRFEVVLLDLQLGMERSEAVIERLRRGGFPVPPIVIYSALPQKELLKSARAVGAKVVVGKPATLEDIGHALAAALQ
jgi:CheY-like chemotaxis protein